MAKKKQEEEQITGTQKEFIKLFQGLCTSRSAWQVWTDFTTAAADSLANVCEIDKERKERREKEYKGCIERLGGVEAPSQMLAVIVMALDNNPEQDFLGEMFMELGLGSNWHGQFFTPYNVCQMMASMTVETDKIKAQIEDEGWIAVNDPACGAGATLIAAANAMQKAGINYQQHAVFVANDIDRTAAQMCYIQLSLLGCAGYVAVTNTLSNPITGPVLFPEEKPDQEFFFTPLWWDDVWTYRRLLGRMRMSMKPFKTEEDHSNMFYLNLEEWKEAVNE